MEAGFRGIRHTQRHLVRQQRAVGKATVKAVESLLTRRVLAILAAGIALGSMLGSAGGEVVRRLIAAALGNH
jgi:hypothetical protein